MVVSKSFLPVVMMEKLAEHENSEEHGIQTDKCSLMAEGVVLCSFTLVARWRVVLPM